MKNVTSARANARQNEKIKDGSAPMDDKDKLIAALRNSLDRDGLMPSKVARIKKRLKVLGVTV